MYKYRNGKWTGFDSLLYLNKLCNHLLGNTTAPLCSQMMLHQVSHTSDPTGSNGNLEEEQNATHEDKKTKIMLEDRSVQLKLLQG